MKTLMKNVAGSKKPKMWNMARFQTRRWHREQEALAKARENQPIVNDPVEKAMDPAPSSARPVHPVESHPQGDAANPTLEQPSSGSGQHPAPNASPSVQNSTLQEPSLASRSS